MARFFALVTAVLAAATIASAQLTSPVGNPFTPGRGARIGTDVYFPDSTGHVILKMTAAGSVSIFAGTHGTSGTADGNKTTALFNAPQGVCTDGTDLYVADTGNHRIRKIAVAGIVTSTPFGPAAATATVSGDALGTTATPNVDARFKDPTDCDFIASTTMYIADKSNHKIKAAVLSTGAVTLVAGTGSAADTDATGASAAFSSPSGICNDGTDLWVADTGNNKIKKVTTAGVSTVQFGAAAGTASVGFVNSATVATQRYNAPSDCLYTGTAGNFYIADKGNNVVRKAVTGGATASTNFIGNGFVGDDNAATGSDSKLAGPVGLVGDAATPATLYTLEENAKRVRKTVVSSGVTTLQAGSINSAFPYNFYSCCFNTDYFCVDNVRHSIYKITAATGVISLLAGSESATDVGTTEGSLSSGVSTARFNSPTYCVADGTAVYVADSGNNKLRKVPKDGTASTTPNGFGGAAADCAGSACSGNVQAAGTTARWNNPRGLALVGTDIYVAETGAHRILKIAAAGGAATQVSGGASLGAPSSGDVVGTATVSRYNAPEGLCYAILGNTIDAIYVADTGNNKIKAITITGDANAGAGTSATVGTSVTLYGPTTDGTTTSGDIGTGAGSAQRFNAPVACAAEQVTGTTISAFLFVADKGNNKVRKLAIAGTDAGRTSTTIGPADGSAGLGNVASTTAANNKWSAPSAIERISATSFLVTDSGNRMIKQMTNLGAVTTGLNAAGDAPSGETLTLTQGASGASPFLASQTADGPVAMFNGVREAAGFNASAAALGSVTDTFYVADTANHVIRKVVYNITTGAVASVSTFLGTVGTSGDVITPAASVLFNGPTAIVANGTDTLYVADSGNHKIKKIVIATDGSATVTILSGPVAGTSGLGDAVGDTATARYNSPQGLAIANFNLYVADTNNQRIKVVTPAGVSTVAWGAASVAGVSGTAAAAPGVDSATPASVTFATPKGLASNGTFVFVADSSSHRVRACSVAAGCTTWLGAASGTADGTGIAATFNTPSGLSHDQFGNLYVADTGNHKIRKVTPAGVVTTVVGTAGGSAGTAGLADQATTATAGVYATATLSGPTYVFFSKTQPTLAFISDSGNNKIRAAVGLGSAAVTVTATATATNTTTITVTNTSTATVTTAANTTTASTTSSNSTTTAPTTTATKTSNAVVAAATAVVVAVLAIFA